MQHSALLLSKAAEGQINLVLATDGGDAFAAMTFVVLGT